MTRIEQPYIEKLELLKNLGARRSMIHEQKILPLIDEFEGEIDEHIRLKDLRITQIFLSFIERYNEFMDTSEETYHHLVEIVNEMVKINHDDFVNKEDFVALQEDYEDVKYGKSEGELGDAQTTEEMMEDKFKRDDYVRKVEKIIEAEKKQGKAVHMMKHVFRKRLKPIYSWQIDVINGLLDEIKEEEKIQKKVDDEELYGDEKIKRGRGRPPKKTEDELTSQIEEQKNEEPEIFDDGIN